MEPRAQPTGTAGRLSAGEQTQKGTTNQRPSFLAPPDMRESEGEVTRDFALGRHGGAGPGAQQRGGIGEAEPESPADKRKTREGFGGGVKRHRNRPRSTRTYAYRTPKRPRSPQTHAYCTRTDTDKHGPQSAPENFLGKRLFCPNSGCGAKPQARRREGVY